MKQRRITWTGFSLANAMLGVAAVPQPDALHPPKPRGVAPSDVALPPTQVLPHGQTLPQVHAGQTLPQVHAPSSPSLHLPDYLPIGSGSSANLDTQGLLMLGGKFLIVMVLLVLSLRILKAIMPRGQAAHGRAGAMVLHSERVADKGRVMLLDLQSRLVVVGSAAGTMTPLTTIEDPEEVAALRAHYRGQQVGPVLRRKGRQAEPSFAALLAQESGAEAQAPARSSRTVVMPAAPPQSTSRTRKLHPAAREPQFTAIPPAPTGSTGDDALAHAITAMRALRHKVEQA